MHMINIPIKGMHCRSCELIIEDKLKELPNVKKVEVSLKNKQAVIISDHNINKDVIEQAIEDIGYEVGIEEKEWITHDRDAWRDLIYSAIVLIVLYYLVKKLGLTSLNFGVSDKPSSLLVVLLIGLTAGISTCMALVGGLVLGISARHSEKHPEASPLQKFRPHLYFNLGRIASYFVLGGLIGMIGKAFQLSGTTLGLLTIIVGIFMVILGLQLTGMFPKLSSGGLTLPSSLSKKLGLKNRHQKEYSHINSTIIGALTFFLPCGFTQAMQLFAMSTGNFLSGALIMGTFALGTAPELLGIGGLTSFIKGAFATKFFKFIGLVVIAFALLNISNGSNLTGLSNKFSTLRFTSQNKVNSDSNVKIENGVQIVRMDQTSAGYKPNKFNIQQGIPVKWIINSKDPQSCAASLYSQKLNIRKFLQSGENIIEFTPNEVGQISFSCSMGMYRGFFNVTANDSPTSINTNSSDSKNNQNINQPNESSSNFSGQVIKTTYTLKDDIQPNRFTIQVGKPVRLEIEAKDNGEGCMGSIAIPQLADKYDFLEKDKTTVFEFTPKQKGEYYITCAMGVPRGLITVTD